MACRRTRPSRGRRRRRESTRRTRPGCSRPRGRRGARSRRGTAAAQGRSAAPAPGAWRAARPASGPGQRRGRRSRRRLVQGDREAQAGLKDSVGVVDVVPVVAVALLHPQAGQGLEASVAESEAAACLDQPVVDVHGLLGRDVQLIAELPYLLSSMFFIWPNSFNPNIAPLARTTGPGLIVR